MSHHRSGAALGAELRNILEAADHADDMADTYFQANGKVAATHESSAEAFRSHEMADVPVPSLVSPVGAAWTWLRDEFQGILGENYTNLRDTARALRVVVATYSSTDEEAASWLRESSYDGDIPEIGDRNDYEDATMPPYYDVTTREEDEDRRER